MTKVVPLGVLVLLAIIGALQGCDDTGLDTTVLSLCGNGRLELGEVCDDGSRDLCGSCNADCSGPGDGSTCGPEPEVLVIFVDADSSAGGDGSTWLSAFSYLQDALNAAREREGPVEIWIAEGVYRPDQSERRPELLGDWQVRFSLTGTITLYGGFTGIELTSEDRDSWSHPTVFSGDILGDDLPDSGNRLDNSCGLLHVTAHASVVVDGVTVTASYGKGSCGGVTVSGPGGTTIFRNSLFVDNTGSTAVKIETSTAAHFTGCRFADNRSHGAGAMQVVEAEAFIDDCEFSNNRSEGSGGAISASGKSLTLTISNTTFRNNFGSRGGAVSNHSWGDSQVVLVNCGFYGNTATHAGAAVLGDAILINSVVVGNVGLGGDGAIAGGRIYFSTIVGNRSNSGAFGGVQGARFLANSIIVDNTRPQVSAVDDRVVRYSCIGEEQDGVGLIEDCAPLFADMDGPDDILGTPDDDLRLLPGSMGLDAGTNQELPADVADLDGDGDFEGPLPLDFAGNPRRADSAATDSGYGDAPLVDMGAYELQ